MVRQKIGAGLLAAGGHRGGGKLGIRQARVRWHATATETPIAVKETAIARIEIGRDEMLKASRERADDVAEQFKSALDELGEVLGREEHQLEKLVEQRPIAALACAFAVGVVVGVALRRI